MASGPRKEGESMQDYRDRLYMADSLERLKRRGGVGQQRLDRVKKIIGGKVVEHAISKKEPETR